jgi:hypothetical protein
VQWVAFGGKGVIRQNNREEQRKIVRYNHLVANSAATLALAQPVTPQKPDKA